MSSQSQSLRNRFVVALLAVVVILCGAATTAQAQDQPLPKWELFGGYSYFDSCSNLNGLKPGALAPVNVCLSPDRWGVGGSLTRNFNRWFGLTLDSSGHWRSNESGLSSIHESRFYNVSVGPKITLYRGTHFVPFVEALGGWHRLSTDTFGSSDRFGFIGGGGIDIPVSKHWGFRLAQADYVMSNHQFGPASVAATELRGFRLQTGLKFVWGGGPPIPPTAACSVQPTEVFAGEPVTVTASGSNFNPKRTIRYEWNGTGVKVSGNNSSAQVDTTGLQAGSYAVNANLSDGSKHGVASCTTRFTVKESHPPVITCSPNPSTVQAGGNSTINSRASSPDGRRLTYSYSATAGSISGTDASTTLNTGNAQPGPITITCNVADDRNPALTASATTTVNVEAPPPPAPPAPPAIEASKLNEIDFKENSPRVDNAAKAILDEVALRLQRDADAKLVLIGEADSSERKGTRLAAQRALNSKAYLVSEKGIDASRIETRTGSEQAKKTQIWLVPAGASLNVDGTQLIDQSKTGSRTRK